MRILAIGLGGAGGRIVDVLYRIDRRSSRVSCVEALAVDVDADSLAKLTGLPGKSKIYFPPIDFASPEDSEDSTPTATIDIAEVSSRVQTLLTSEDDAIVICTGLGGSLVDIAPNLITTLRSSVTEPIFGLVTLPCLAEGERWSAKAADDLEMISPLLDGVIIFDNETWYKKIQSQQKTLARDNRGIATRLGLKKKQEQTGSPANKVYFLLNDAIVKRISLILRAGEFRADGGIDLAEVVLDAGEVLNTMRGMGFMTIGYAVEQLPSHPLSFLTKWRPTGYFADEHQKKASRIVDLAKQAIYHEISTPCDITSAHKALVLIAGPSHELSMKGYMTVRKWIDRSIAGLETRSGDYPVMSTKFIAIIIMLSGLENIPRIEELKKIRAQYKVHLAEGLSTPEETAGSVSIAQQQGGAALSPSLPQTPQLRDEMISLSGRIKPGSRERASTGIEELGHQPRSTISYESSAPESGSRQKPTRTTISKTGTDQIRHYFVTTDSHVVKQTREGMPADRREISPPIKKILASHPVGPVKKSIMTLPEDNRVRNKDLERQKIERELQKQRLMAISGKDAKIDQHRPMPAVSDRPYPRRQPEVKVERKGGELPKTPDTARVTVRKEETRKIVLHKKKERTDQGIPASQSHTDEYPPEGKNLKTERGSDTFTIQGAGGDSIDSWVKQASYRTKGELIDNAGVKLKDVPKTARDDALLHTNLKRGRTPEDNKEVIAGIKTVEPAREIEPGSKKHDKMRSDDDVSWVK